MGLHSAVMSFDNVNNVDNVYNVNVYILYLFSVLWNKNILLYVSHIWNTIILS